MSHEPLLITYVRTYLLIHPLNQGDDDWDRRLQRHTYVDIWLMDILCNKQETCMYATMWASLHYWSRHTIVNYVGFSASAGSQKPEQYTSLEKWATSLEKPRAMNHWAMRSHEPRTLRNHEPRTLGSHEPRAMVFLSEDRMCIRTYVMMAVPRFWFRSLCWNCLWSKITRARFGGLGCPYYSVLMTVDPDDSLHKWKA